jgi:hypothetical protein
MAWERL